MSEAFHYTTTYKLDKAQFSETYDESVTLVEPKKAYQKALLISLAGVFLLYFTDVNSYIAWFFIALGGLDAVGTRFQKPWWLTRQMISKAANSELTLSIDEEGIASQSHYVDSKILWSEMTKIEQTARGWLLYSSKGKTYVSRSCLSEQADEFIRQQGNKIQSQ